MISIVTPSYNQASYIEETIRSVEKQECQNIEHIIVDGGSVDGTIEVLRDHEATTHWVSEPDDGQADAINKGLNMASGEIVGWLNSDDVYFDTEVISRVSEYFRRYDADIIYGDAALLDPNSDVLKIRCVPEFDYDRLLRGCFIEQPALFFRKKVLDGQRLDVDLEYVMDYEFWLRLSREYEFRHVEDILAGDRNHRERKILNQRDAMQEEAAEIAQEYGATTGTTYRAERLNDMVTSGLPRRLKAAARTLQLHYEPPELAFDGQLYPLSEMIANVARPNRTLV